MKPTEPMPYFIKPPKTDAVLRLESLPAYISLDYQHIEFMAASMVRYALDRVSEKIGTRGVLVTLSGGSDSSTVTAACKRAMSYGVKSDLLAVTVVTDPDNRMESEDLESATSLCRQLNVEHKVFDARQIVDETDKIIGIDNSRVYADSVARARNALVRSTADKYGLLVAGTSNKSENMIRGFADGLAQPSFSFIRELYKTEVINFGRHLGVPESILSRDPGGSEMRRTEAELYGASYVDCLDAVLYLLDSNMKPEDISSHGIDLEWLKDLETRVKDHEWRTRSLVYDRQQLYGGE